MYCDNRIGVTHLLITYDATMVWGLIPAWIMVDYFGLVATFGPRHRSTILADCGSRFGIQMDSKFGFEFRFIAGSIPLLVCGTDLEL